MDFTSLPVDVLTLFFDELIQRNLKRVRLVCRTLHEIVKLRIPRVFFSPNRANINAFRGIAEHEVFRHKVREIIWDDARLSLYQRQRLPLHIAIQVSEDLRLGTREIETDGKTFEHYVHEVQEHAADLTGEKKSLRKKELWGYDAQNMSLEDSFDLYNRLYDEQQAIIESGEDVETLKLGLQSFPALRRLTVTSETWRLDPLFPDTKHRFFAHFLLVSRCPYPGLG